MLGAHIVLKRCSNVISNSMLRAFGLRNPVPVMPLVEVIRGLRTDDATLQLTLQLCTAMKKETTLAVYIMPLIYVFRSRIEGDTLFGFIDYCSLQSSGLLHTSHSRLLTCSRSIQPVKIGLASSRIEF